MRPERDHPWLGRVLAFVLACAATTPAAAGVCLGCGSGGGGGGGSGGGSPPPPPPPPTLSPATGFVSEDGFVDLNPSYSQYSALPGGALSLSGADGYTSASASLDLGEDPAVHVSAEASSGAGANVYAQAQVYYTYQFLVSGPASAVVPVDVNAVLTATESGAGPYAVAGANILVGDTNTGTGVTGWTDPSVCAAVGASCHVGGSDVVSQTIDVTTGDVITVYLNANVDATDYVAGTSIMATASIDPTFVVDPTFLAANPGYTLTYGRGVLSVPEPGAWSLMIVGIGLAGGVFRRCRGGPTGRRLVPS